MNGKGWALIVLGIGVSAAVYWKSMPDRKTIQDRLDKFRPVVHERLLPLFEAKQVAYPPQQLIFAGLKEEKLLEVWAAAGNGNFRLITRYPILAASGRIGPKLREGDLQVPEGLYRIESLNPNSKFHLALRVDYPNPFDREQAAREGRTQLGGDIMIHGNQLSVGCLAMGDPAAEDLFVLAAVTGLERIAVILSPVDFLTRAIPEDTLAALPPWTSRLYDKIRAKIEPLAEN